MGNLKFEGNFAILYLLWVVHCPRTLKIDHSLSLVYHWLPLATTDLVVDNTEGI